LLSDTFLFVYIHISHPFTLAFTNLYLISLDAVLTWFHPYVDSKLLGSNPVSFSLPGKHSMHVEF